MRKDRPLLSPGLVKIFHSPYNAGLCGVYPTRWLSPDNCLLRHAWTRLSTTSPRWESTVTEDQQDRPYSPLERARQLYRESLGLAQSGDFKGAIGCLEEVLVLDPNHVGARCNLGAIYRQTGHIDNAVDCFLEALELDSSHARTHANIGAAFFDKGMIEDAEMAFRKAIELDPALPEPHYNLALLHLSRREYDRAWAEAKNTMDLGMKTAQALLEQIEKILDA